MKFEDSMECLSEYFMQEGNYEKMVEVGKLLSSVVCTMFRDYLNLSKGFVPFRYHKVVGYMKKLLQKYSCISRDKYRQSSSSPNLTRVNSLNNSPSR